MRYLKFLILVALALAIPGPVMAQSVPITQFSERAHVTVN